MVFKCCVRECHSKEYLQGEEHGTLQFYRFPINREVSDKWLDVCVKPLVNVKQARVCSLHFDEDSYNLEIRPPNLPKKQLKADAIPTLLLPNRQEDTNKLYKLLDETEKEEIVICPDISEFAKYTGELSSPQSPKTMNTTSAENDPEAVIETPKYRLRSARVKLQKLQTALLVQEKHAVEEKIETENETAKNKGPAKKVDKSAKGFIIDLTDEEPCCIPNCSTNHGSKTKVQFFPLPKGGEKKTIWLDNIPYKSLKLTKNSRICHKHFEKHCFVKTVTFVDQNFKKCTYNKTQWDLKDDATPTIFPSPHSPAANLQAKSTQNKSQEQTVAPSNSVPTKFHLDSTCRTCSVKIDKTWQCAPLFEGTLSLKRFRPDLLEEILRIGLEIHQNDGLPQQICQKCIDSFSIVIQFQKQCHHVQEELAKFFKKNKNPDSGLKEDSLVLEGKKMEAPNIQARHKDVTKDALPSPRTQALSVSNLETSPIVSVDLTEQLLEGESEVSFGSKSKVQKRNPKRNLTEAKSKRKHNVESNEDSAVSVTENKSKKQKAVEEATTGQQILKVAEESLIVGTFMDVDDDPEELSDHESRQENIADDDIGENWKCEYFIDPDDKNDMLKVLGDSNQESTHKTSPYATHKPVAYSESNSEKKRCKLCQRITRYCCDKCPSSTRLCLEPCFEAFHNRLDETDKGKPVTVRGYVCEKCNRILPSEEVQNIHRKYCKGLPYECMTCSIKFAKQEQLLRHNVKFHNSDKNPECPTGNKHSPMKLQGGEDEREILMHTGGKPALCDICGKSFPNKEDLMKHMVNHNGKIEFASEVLKNGLIKYLKDDNDDILGPVVNFNCEYCGMKKLRTKSISTHFQEVHGVKFDESRLQVLPGMVVARTTCNLCRKRCKSQVALNRHEAIAHNPAKKNECHKCGMRFAKLYNLRSHLKLMNCTQTIFKCKLCPVAKTSKRSFTWHMKMHKNKKRQERLLH